MRVPDLPNFLFSPQQTLYQEALLFERNKGGISEYINIISYTEDSTLR
jgi:hypothetical protein